MTNSTCVMNLEDRWFNYVASGEKIYECRIFDDTLKNLKISEYIFFNNKAACITKKKLIVGLLYFSSLEEMFVEIPIEKLLPGITSIEEGIRIYKNIPGYELDSIHKGILVIKLY